MSRRFRWFFLIWALVPASGYAGTTVWFLYDKNNKYHVEFVTGSQLLLHEHIPDANFQTISLNSDDPKPEKNDTNQIVVTVGVTAAKSAVTLGLPAINTLLTRRSFSSIRDRYTSPVTANYLEQPLERHLQLIRTTLPTTREIVLLGGGRDENQLQEYTQVSRRLFVDFRYLHLSQGKGINEVVGSELNEGDVLLLLPDPDTVNRNTVKSLVLESYRARVALIGYSQALVKAGALMAVHTPMLALQKKLVKSVAYFKKWHVLPAPSYATEFAVAVNYQLARALKLTLPSEEDITQILQEKQE